IPFGGNRPTCPVRALKEWLRASGIKEGPLFRPVNRHGHLGTGRLTPQSVALVVKRAAEAAGMNHARYSGHSLRAGLVTAARKGRVADHIIMRQTRHKGRAMLDRYFRDADLFDENAAAGIGL